MTNKECIQTSNMAKIAAMIKVSDGIERSSKYGIMESDMYPIMRRLHEILQGLEKETRCTDSDVEMDLDRAGL